MTKRQATPVWVVIPAAGVGRRMLSDQPKQYIKIHNKTLIEHTLNCFFEHKLIAGVVVVLNPTDPYWSQLKVNSLSKPLHTVLGGTDRSDSVIQGLIYLEEVIGIDKSSWVMVHDSVRPCLEKSDIDALLRLRATDNIGGLLAAPVRDTMKRSIASEEKNNSIKKVLATEPRDKLWHALTPQMFRVGDLLNALKHCKDKQLNVTDDSSAMELIGEQPVLVEGSHNNIKVTHPSDIEMASFLLSRSPNNKEE